MILTKKQKIISGVGIVSGLSILYLLLKSRLGFGDTPVETWQRTRMPVKSNIANNRAQARNLQNIAMARRDWSQREARRKQRKKDAAAAAEAGRREAIWRRTRRKIDSN